MIASFVGFPILPRAIAASFRIESSLSPNNVDNFGIAFSAIFPIFPNDRAASRHILQSSSSKQLTNLSIAFIDLSPSSPKTWIELNLMDLI